MRELLGSSVPPKEPPLSAEEKHTDYHNEVKRPLQGRGEGPKATLVILGPGPRSLLLTEALARPMEWLLGGTGLLCRKFLCWAPSRQLHWARDSLPVGFPLTDEDAGAHAPHWFQHPGDKSMPRHRCWTCGLITKAPPPPELGFTFWCPAF